jgi:hypothetical protein
MASNMTEQKKPANLKTALVLLSIAAAFFIGVVIKRWLFAGP